MTKLKSADRVDAPPGERAALRALVDRIGLVATLDVLAGIVAHDHPDVSTGDEIRSMLRQIARRLEQP
jgi:hypothetical protein